MSDCGEIGFYEVRVGEAERARLTQVPYGGFDALRAFLPVQTTL